MQFILEVNERVVASQVESNVAQNASDDTRTHDLSLGFHNDLHQVFRRVLDSESGERFDSEVDAESFGDTFDAKEIVSVGSNFNLVDILVFEVHSVAIAVDAIHLHFLSRAVLELNSKVEAKVFEFILGCKNDLLAY